MSHGAVRFLLRCVESVFLVALLGGAVLAWRLSQGPVSISSLAPYVAETLSELDPTLRFHIDRAEFRWMTLNGRPEITMGDIRVQDFAGGVIAGLPSMVVRLSGQALLRGVIAPNRVVLTSPIIRFIHRADGSWGLGIENPTPNVPPAVPATNGEIASGTAVARSLITALTRPTGVEARAQYLDRVAIENSTLVLVDEKSGQRWIAPDATLTFTRAGQDLDLRASIPVVEDGKRWNLTAHGVYVTAEDQLKLDINVEGFRPPRIAGLAPQLAPLEMIDLRLNGTIATTFAFASDVAHITETRFEVRGQDGHLKLPEPLDTSYPIKNLTLKGSAAADLDQIAIDQFRIELDRKGESPTITMTAHGKSLNTMPELSLEAQMPELSLAALKDYWPLAVKPNTNAWIKKNLTLGGLSDTKLKMALTGPTFDQLEATDVLLMSNLHGVTVNYLDRMPKVEATDGVMTLTTREMVIDVSNGFVADPISGKGLRVPSGKLRMYNFGGKPERADFQLKIVGDFGDAMRLVDHEPLGYVTKMGLDATRATGTADIDLTIGFPLIKELKLAQVEIATKAKVEDGAIPNVAFGLPLHDARLFLDLDMDGMDVTGSAILGDIPSTVTWRENFGVGDFRSKYILDPIISNAQRPLVGLSASFFAPPYIDGAAKAHVVYTVNRDATSVLDADLDLTTPTMAIPELGWHKSTGEPAGGKVTARFVDGHLVSVPTFHVQAEENLDLSGAMTFAADQSLQRLDINSSIVGDTSLSGELTRDSSGAYAVDVSGPAFNSTYFWKQISRDDSPGSEAPNAPQTPLRLRARFDRMWLASGGEFRDVNLSLERSTVGIQTVDLTALVDGVTPVTFALAPTNGKRTFKGASADGGSVVRAIGLFGDIVGGQLDISGELAPDGTLKGEANIQDFKLRQAPIVARLLSVAALTGILDELRGDGISFKTLRLPFTYANSTVSISNGEMFGNSIGLTAKGTYNLAQTQMDMEGTLVPAYAVNSVLNSIPLIGSLLSGGDKGGGVFAATYTYRGNPATAEPSVNPLAVLTPGFLRHIFDIFRSKPRPPPTSIEKNADAQSAPASQTSSEAAVSR